MRSSVFIAIASALIATVAAHDGPHDPPAGGAPSVCLTTPTDASCASYDIPKDTLATAIGDICKVSSFLPGCSLNAACSADSALPATYCAPLTILATLCTSADDASLTSAVCSKTYDVYCGASSLIPGCKANPAFPGLPSGKLVTGAVYSICQEMSSMKDCSICPAPDATGYSKCDEVKAWKGLCLDMPDMSQCPSYNTMCSNTKFDAFCSSTYVSPNGGSSTSGAQPTPTDHSDHGAPGNAAGSLAAGSLAVVAAALAGISALVL
ncbi:hypothetical protein BG011_009285 [Mortierella polycephala]|uniref:Uncharacterized protein n=1 Tax=Mortierella polycephala TaxID=41804 RepID=A0A9P6Q9Q2_9FUNG|nr:hypothetical protein BG011_009285 [Mortierella polycephala]